MVCILLTKRVDTHKAETRNVDEQSENAESVKNMPIVTGSVHVGKVG